jgi:type I restriction enzyme R subunit
VPYDDVELEQLCVYAKHVMPLLRIERLADDDDIDLTDIELTHYRLTKQAEQQIKLGEGDSPELAGITAVGAGQPHDPEKKRLSEIIDALNELFGAEVSDHDKLHFAQGIAERIRRDDAVMAQIDKHTPDEVMHGRYPKLLADTVLDAMTDHEKLSMEVLSNPAISQQFAKLVLGILKPVHVLDRMSHS